MQGVKVFFDGGCRGDPPAMEAAVVIRGEATMLCGLGPGTSTDAEWLALIHAAALARAHGLADVVLIGDCADVIAKASGATACRGDAGHFTRFRAEAASLARWRVRLVRRSHNLAGIALARRHAR